MILLFLFLLPLSCSAISFDQAVSDIINRDQLIKAQEKLSKASKLSSLSGKLNYLPKISIGAKKIKDYELDRDGEQIYTSVGLNIYNGGADYSNQKIKKNEYLLAKLNEKKQRLDSEKNAVESILSYILSKKQLELQIDNRKLYLNSLNIAKKRFSQGLIPKEDIEKIEIDYLNSDVQVSNAKINFEKSKKSLSSLLGHTEIDEDWPWTSKINKIEINKIKAINYNADENVEHHVLKIQDKIQSGTARYFKADLFPKLNLEFSANKGISGYLDSQVEKIGMVTLSYSLFNGLSDMSNYKLEKAKKILTKAQLEHSSRLRKSEWDERKSTLIETIENLKIRQRTLNLAKKLLNVAERNFKRGRSSINDLKLDQTRLLESRNAYIEGWQNVHLKLLELCQEKSQFYKACIKSL